MGSFFTSDIVALKADPTVIAVVVATSRDTDLETEDVRDDWVFHGDTNAHAWNRVIQGYRPPDGFVLVGFAAPGRGRTVVAEGALTLLDRSSYVGDVVKRSLQDFESGTVTNTRIQCRIRPIYTDLPYQGKEPWPHKPEENELWVPSGDLRFDDYLPGDYVAYKGWIGEVVNIRQEVLLCLKNGSVVRVRDPDELEVLYYSAASLQVGVEHVHMSLAENMAAIRQSYERMADAEPTTTGDPAFYPGQRVQTKKSNLRLGFWVYGSYSASVPAKGVVVQARVIELDVDWVTTNYYDRDAAARPPPEDILTTDDLDEVKLCTTQIPGSPFGSRITREKMIGDICRFQFDPDAEAKYPKGSAAGFFRRIPRTITQGYNMNTFTVMETRSEIEVEWQDGSRTWQKSTATVPYAVPDDHDLWPGEVVVIKDAVSTLHGVSHMHKIGIVQSVDAKDRTANVRWFVEPRVACPADDLATLLPGSKCGPLSQEVSSLSLYELFGFAALARRRGDIVLVLPKNAADDHSDMVTTRLTEANSSEGEQPTQDTESGNPLSNGELGRQEAGTMLGNAANSIVQIASRLAGAVQTEGQQHVQRTEGGNPWIGEVVNVARDGKITVRLGAQQPPRDVELFIDEVTLLLAPDLDDDEEEEEEGEFAEEDISMAVVGGSSNRSAVEALEETIEYEGGTRLDNEDEDAWMTDTSGSAASGDEGDESADKLMDVCPDTGDDSAPASERDVSMKEVPDEQQAAPATAEPTDRLEDGPNTQAEYRFNEFPTMPPQFLILDEPPPENHHFFSHDHSWNSPGMLKRIRKEHKLLQSSLPRGIWVRTWADRLDLLRVLIIGPQGTPYALAPFVLDFAFGNGYPKMAPETFFHSWTGNVGKINPNLYENGTVCLSILGTWPESHDNEAWNSERSSMLQILVSLLGLVLVERPYYNEAGFEDMAGRDEALVNERIYSEKALVMAHGFVVHALTHPVPGVADVINWVYRDPRGPRLLDWVVRDARKLRGDTTTTTTAESTGAATAARAAAAATTTTTTKNPRLSKGALMLLEKHLPKLEAILDEDVAAVH